MSNFELGNFLSENEVLRRASNFILKGRVSDAITFLEEALVTRPRSQKIIRALGELYIKSGQVEVAHQRGESLSASLSSPTETTNSDLPAYYDYAYLDEQMSELSEEEYDFAQVQDTSSTRPTLTLNKKTQDPIVRKTSSPTSDITPGTTKTELDGIAQIILPHKNSQKPSSDNSEYSVNANYKAKLNRSNSEKSTISGNDKLIKSEPENEVATTHLPHLRGAESDEDVLSKGDLVHFDETVTSQDEFTTQLNDECNVDVDETVDIDELYFVSELAEGSATDEAELFDFWDDESSSLEEDESEKSVALDNRLTIEERAKLIAVECILDFEWDTNKLSFLTELFSTRAWGSTKKALEREVQIGTTVDELELAFEVKTLWQDSSRYWISFSKAWALSESADATYQSCSWKQALYLVRAFNGLPSIEEIYDFLECEFDNWYHNRILRRCFPAFSKYLFMYRLNARNISTMFEGFELPVEHDGLEGDWLQQPLSKEMFKLSECGLELANKFSTKTYYATDLYTNEYMFELIRLSDKSNKGESE